MYNRKVLLVVIGIVQHLRLTRALNRKEHFVRENIKCSIDWVERESIINNKFQFLIVRMGNREEC